MFQIVKQNEWKFYVIIFSLFIYQWYSAFCDFEWFSLMDPFSRSLLINFYEFIIHLSEAKLVKGVWQVEPI